jgi:hypothetical protein
MANNRLEGLIAEMEAAGRTEDAEELSKLRGSFLRKQLAGTQGLEEQHAEALAENARLKREQATFPAFAAAGVDVQHLSKLERDAVASYSGDLEDEESIHAYCEDLEIG